jgi:acyl-CoA reductase-like NAD-dependent aldehyde dehydrogenase
MALINTSREARSGETISGFVEHHQLFMSGEWRKPHSDNLIQVFSANTEQLIGSVPDSDSIDVDSAVQAARTAFDDPAGWPHWEPAARAELIRKLADAIEERSDEVARRVSDQNGMPILMSAAAEAHVPPQILRYCADVATSEAAKELRGSSRTSVVDPELKVHGIEHLRIADASVMPSTVSGNTKAAVLAIAERAASLLMSERRTSGQ